MLQNLGLLVVFALLAVFAYIFWQQNQPNAITKPNSSATSTSTSTKPNTRPSRPGDYKVIFGEFVILGKQPDGDSVRFKADNSSLFSKLKNASRLKESKDGTVRSEERRVGKEC